MKFWRKPLDLDQQQVARGDVHILRERCKGCGYCVEFCPEQVLKLDRGGPGLHRRGNRMTSEAAIAKLFERFGVSADEFERTWNSFEVDQKLRVAEDLARRYSIQSVPAVVVNGKYRTGGKEAGGYGKLPDLIDELVVRESAR